MSTMYIIKNKNGVLYSLEDEQAARTWASVLSENDKTITITREVRDGFRLMDSRTFRFTYCKTMIRVH